MSDPFVVVQIGEIEKQISDLFLELESDNRFNYLDLKNVKQNKELLRGSKLLFGVHLKEFGVNPNVDELIALLGEMYQEDSNLFDNSVGAVIISSQEEEYTKQKAANLVYRLNKMGLRFSGRPLLEAPKGLSNLKSYAKRNGKSLEENLKINLKSMLNHLEELYLQYNTLPQFLQNNDNEKGLTKKTKTSKTSYSFNDKPKKKLLVLHSSNDESNTLELWKMIKENFGMFDIKEIYLANGEVMDCKACSYTICKHFAKQKSCYYGGIMVEDVYPAIIESDIIFLLCPNYNDALTANITAMINRLTALFRSQKFYCKKIYCVIVSGSSGTETIGTQVIRALNMNKTFQLPPYFSISAIANDRGDIFKLDDISNKVQLFSKRVIDDNQ